MDKLNKLNKVNWWGARLSFIALIFMIMFSHQLLAIDEKKSEFNKVLKFATNPSRYIIETIQPNTDRPHWYKFEYWTYQEETSGNPIFEKIAQLEAPLSLCSCGTHSPERIPIETNDGRLFLVTLSHHQGKGTYYENGGYFYLLINRKDIEGDILKFEDKDMLGLVRDYQKNKLQAEKLIKVQIKDIPKAILKKWYKYSPLYI